MPEKSNSKNAQGIFEPFKIDEVPWIEFTNGRFGMRYKELGEFGGATQVGICFEELAPGQQANQAHYHREPISHSPTVFTKPLKLLRQGVRSAV